MLYEYGSLVKLNDLYRYPHFVSLTFAAPPSPEVFTAVKTTDVQNKRMYRETQDHNSKQGEYMRSSDYYWFENLDGRTDDYRYPDILDIIEQEEKAKQKRKRSSKQKPRMNRENIRIRMAIGMYVTREEFDYYRRTCTPQEREELECFYALHSCMSGFGIAGLYTAPSRGLNLGYSEGYTSTVVEMNGRRSLVMMPTSTPDINIEADSTRRVHTVLDVLQNNLHEDFGKALQYLTDTCPSDIVNTLDITDAIPVSYEGCCVKRVESSWEQRLDNFNTADFTVYVPNTDPLFTGSLSVIPLQLLGYYVSIAKGFDVDKPRNLAKSVTVE